MKALESQLLPHVSECVYEALLMSKVPVHILILQAMTNITDAVLASTLKELMTVDVIGRIKLNEISTMTGYSLMDKSISVVPILQSICRWSGAYHKEDSKNTLLQCQKCDYI